MLTLGHNNYKGHFKINSNYLIGQIINTLCSRINDELVVGGKGAGVVD